MSSCIFLSLIFSSRGKEKKNKKRKINRKKKKKSLGIFGGLPFKRLTQSTFCQVLQKASRLPELPRRGAGDEEGKAVRRKAVGMCSVVSFSLSPQRFGKQTASEGGRGVQSTVHWGSPHTHSKAQPPQPLLPQTALPQTGQSSDVSRRVNYRPLDGAYLRWL